MGMVGIWAKLAATGGVAPRGGGRCVRSPEREIEYLLRAGTKLPAANKDHALKGNWKGARDCHLKPDLVLIYRKTAVAIELARIGSHSEVFG